MTDSDQPQPEDTLVDRGTDDILDEGISPPEKLRGSTAKGVTNQEQREGETIDERLRQEEPDPAAAVVLDDDAAADTEDRDPRDVDAGDSRAGRLIAPDGGIGPDDEKQEIADDVGIAGGAASAEEAAVHVRDEGRDE